MSFQASRGQAFNSENIVDVTANLPLKRYLALFGLNRIFQDDNQRYLPTSLIKTFRSTQQFQLCSFDVFPSFLS